MTSFLIGVAGGTGSGKTTLTRNIIVPASGPNEKAIKMIVDRIHRRSERQKRKK